MKGQVDTRYLTVQQDVFDSGIAKKVGMNAFGIWLAVKAHSDFNTGECWPGIRHLADVTGLAKSTIQRGIKTLVDESMLRVIDGGRGTRSTRYVPRERLVVYVGGTLLCTIVVDYVPAQLPETLEKIKSAIENGQGAEALTDCEIIPGPSFTWNPEKGQLTAKLSTLEIQEALLKTRVKNVGKKA